MGRKAGGIYINPKKFGSLSKPCTKEMVSFLNCLAINRDDGGDRCVRQKDLLNACLHGCSGPFRLMPFFRAFSFFRIAVCFNRHFKFVSLFVLQFELLIY